MRYLSAIAIISSVIVSVAHSANAWNYEMKKIPCRDEVIKVDSDEFEWKYREDDVTYVTAEKGICWHNSVIVTRMCNTLTGGWIPETVICDVIERKNKFCPEDLIEIAVDDRDDEYLCLKVSDDRMKFDEKFCFGADVTPDRQDLSDKEMRVLLEYLKSHGIESYWLPVQRPFNDQYTPFLVRLPGKEWGEVFDVSLHARDFLSSQHCLAGIVNKGSTLGHQISHCDNLFHSVCVFKEKFVAYSGCPQGFGALTYRPKVCYGIDWEAGLYPDDLQMVNISEYLANRNSLQLIFKQLIDGKTPNQYFLVDSFTDQMNNYSIQMNAKERVKTKLLTQKHPPALSKEVLADRRKVEMTLKWDNELEELILTVYNRNYIWRTDDEDTYGIKCFTNADYEQWKVVKLKLFWKNELDTKSMYKVKRGGDGPGFYWCEAHSIFDFELIQSPKVIAADHRNGHIFSMLFNVPCGSQDCLDFNRNVKSLSKKVKSKLNDIKDDRNNKKRFENILINSVRIIDITSVSKDRSFVMCRCHITVSLKSSSVDNSYEDSSEEQKSEEDDEGVRYDTSVRMEMYRLLTSLVRQKFPDVAQTIRSTVYCFPENFPNSNVTDNRWLTATLGETVTSAKLCLHTNGLPITRKCMGDYVSGAYWETLNSTELECNRISEKKVITKDLFEMTLVKIPENGLKTVAKNLETLIEDNMSKLIPADVYYMAKIMKSITKSVAVKSIKDSPSPDIFGGEPTPPTTVDETTMDNIVRVYNYIMKVNEKVIKSSLVLNATNILLESFEDLIDQMSLIHQHDSAMQSNVFDMFSKSLVKQTDNVIKAVDKSIDTIIHKDLGVTVKTASNFVIFIIDPEVRNITGVAIYGIDADSSAEPSDLGKLSGAMENDGYKFILANQNVEDLLFEENLQLATYVPETLWNRLDEISRLSNYTAKERPKPKIVIKLYANDIFFQENNATSKSSMGRVISISIPGHDKHLPELLPLILRVDSKIDLNSGENGCRYWNYSTWAKDGLLFLTQSEIDENLILCGCTHLTPFAYLIGGNHFEPSTNASSELNPFEEVNIEKHIRALDLITLLGCSLSMIGIVGIFLTAISFQSWREKASSKVLLQLSAAIALQMVLFCFVNTEENMLNLMKNHLYVTCVVTGAALQYSVLVQFCWMIIIAYLQFKRYVQVFGNIRPTRFFIKSAALGWGLPLIPVLAVMIFDRQSYIPKTTYASICYPTGLSMYLGVVMPVTFVILANLIIYFIVIYNILRGPAQTMRHTENRLLIYQIRLSVLLFFLLGFTWIFGLLSAMKAGIIFSYLFCITATMQGFVLFIYFVLLDPGTRRMWNIYFRKLLGVNTNYEMPSSVKETTQTG